MLVLTHIHTPCKDGLEAQAFELQTSQSASLEIYEVFRSGLVWRVRTRFFARQTCLLMLEGGASVSPLQQAMALIKQLLCNNKRIQIDAQKTDVRDEYLLPHWPPCILDNSCRRLQNLLVAPAHVELFLLGFGPDACSSDPQHGEHGLPVVHITC